MQVLITGANRGIGAALTQLALAKGHSVTGTARHIAGLTGAQKWLAFDVTSAKSAADLARNMAGQPLDLLVCNAGVYPDKGVRDIGDYTTGIWQNALQTNVTGVFFTLQALLPNLRAARGKIVVISSNMGSGAHAPGGSYAYRASKAAVNNLVANLAVDLRGAGIAVGSYHPGWVRTDMGGTGGEIAVETSAQGLWRRFMALSPETSGTFESYDGTQLDY